MNQMESASLYTDFNSLGELRRGAKENSPETIKAVAQQFEAIFVQMMMKSMRDAKLADGLFDSDQTDQYVDLYDKQLANTLSSQGQGIGLADVIARQLGGASQQGVNIEEAVTNIPERLTTKFILKNRIDSVNSTSISEKAAEPMGDASVSDTSAAQKITNDYSEPVDLVINTPEDFVNHLWPMAEKAAASLNVDPKAILAQAALETGWGRSVIRSNDGKNSHNLFNIKSGQSWNGDSVIKSSLEFSNGLARQEKSSFRSYGSYEESFQDYVSFLQSNPRYEKALNEGTSAGKYLKELQNAGYATDPRYAEKIESIMNRGQFVSSISAAANNITPQNNV